MKCASTVAAILRKFDFTYFSNHTSCPLAPSTSNSNTLSCTYCNRTKWIKLNCVWSSIQSARTFTEKNPKNIFKNVFRLQEKLNACYVISFVSIMTVFRKVFLALTFIKSIGKSSAEASFSQYSLVNLSFCDWFKCGKIKGCSELRKISNFSLVQYLFYPSLALYTT